jgi:hypothetical protein
MNTCNDTAFEPDSEGVCKPVRVDSCSFYTPVGMTYDPHYGRCINRTTFMGFMSQNMFAVVVGIVIFALMVS